jgi:hypothetical protein
MGKSTSDQVWSTTSPLPPQSLESPETLLPEIRPEIQPGGQPEILIPVSLGELADRLEILQLKVIRIQGPGLAHVQRELALLQARFEPLAPRVPEPLQRQLAAVNAELWQLEDAVRSCERRATFGAEFVAMARSIYRLNDRRAALKRAISLAGGSPLLEEKVFGEPGA